MTVGLKQVLSSKMEDSVAYVCLGVHIMEWEWHYGCQVMLFPGDVFPGAGDAPSQVMLFPLLNSMSGKASPAQCQSHCC